MRVHVARRGGGGDDAGGRRAAGAWEAMGEEPEAWRRRLVEVWRVSAAVRFCWEAGAAAGRERGVAAVALLREGCTCNGNDGGSSIERDGSEHGGGGGGGGAGRF